MYYGFDAFEMRTCFASWIMAWQISESKYVQIQPSLVRYVHIPILQI